MTTALASVLILASGLAIPQDSNPPPAFEGAAAVIRAASEQAPKDATVEKPQKPRTPFDDLNDAVQKRLEAVDRDNVAAWLGLVDQLIDISATSPNIYYGGSGRHRSGLALLVTAIPSPAAWPELAEAIRARPIGDGQQAMQERSLRLLAALLMSDEAGQWAELAAIQDLIAAAGPDQTQQFSATLQNLSQQLATTSDDPKRRVATFEFQLRRAEQTSDSDTLENMRFFGLDAPDLVLLVGSETAEGLLRRAVKLPIMITAPNGEETQQLARRVALEEIDRLQFPQWKLCFTMEAMDLFEAMHAKFVVAVQAKAEEVVGDDPAARIEAMQAQARGHLDQDQIDRALSGARFHYLMGLVAAGRFEDAQKIAATFPEDEQSWYYHMYGRNDRNYTAVYAITHSPHAQRAEAFFHDLLEQQPNRPFWRVYTEIATYLGAADRPLTLMKVAAAKPDLSVSIRENLRQQLKLTLLATDRIDEAMALVREDFTGPPDQYGSSRAPSAATEMMNISLLQNRIETFDEGLAQALKSLEGVASHSSSNTAANIANLLSRAGRGADAEHLLSQSLARELGKKEMSSFGDPVQVLLERLARVYHAAGRHADVVALLDQAPWWGVKDMIGLRDDSMSNSGEQELPLSALAAESLAAVGRYTEAGVVARAVIRSDPGLDIGYQVLLQVDADNAIAHFDERFALDQFEERPLIWKAEALRRSSRLDAAEATIKQAIAIDPSDGEQGHGRRMRAYTVFADIRTDQGNQKEAEFLQSVVKAVRQAEQADRLYAAGLKTRGIELYNQALSFFADAYCIQSRLAVQLASMGRHEEAAEHYRRAYELMPDSFGRMESHCFGCEQVFDGLQAEAVAEDVFTKLASARPDDARVHYLLGYLREQQDRTADALEAYRRAVRIDADYLNAWTKIFGMGFRTHVSSDIRDEAAANLYRLRLNAKQWNSTLDSVRDLELLWRTAESFQPAVAEKVESTYPLAASKVQMEKLEAAQRESGRTTVESDRWGGMRMSTNQDPPDPPREPAEVLAGHTAVRAVSELFASRIK